MSLSNATITTYENFTPSSAPTYTEGRTWYDNTAHALAYYNDVSSVTVHLGQDLLLKVINNTGTSIPNGSPVYVTGTSSGQTYPNIALAKADVAATAAVIGLTNGAIANAAVGYVTAQGGIDNVNTGTFQPGQVLYLSPYSAGQLQNTVPATGIVVQVGVVTYVDSSLGKIYVKQTSPLNVAANIITGIVSVSNGGTGINSAGALGNVLTSTGSAWVSQAANVTIGNTTVALGNTATSLGNVTLANVTIATGNINVTTTNHTANVTANATFATSSLPLVPAGYIVYDLNGTLVKIPYYGV